ncbi:MAG: outer membrane beta-barrel protein, partial [Bacteroidota bacterium]
IGLQNAAINNATIPILPEQREILKTEAKQTLIHSRLNPVELKNISSMTATSALPTLPKQSAIVVKDKKSIQQILYPMRPKGIEVGTSYGLGRSLAAHHRNQEITHWGINAQTKFSDPIRLWMAADYEALEYESTKMGAAYGIPEIVPSSDNLEFDEANVSQHLLSISTGLQYRFRVAKKWQPFIGIGYGLSKFNSNIIKYRFEEPSVTNQIVGEIETVIYENTSNLSFGIFNSGILYQLNDKFSFQLGGEYRYRIKNDNNQLPNILSGKLGAHFSF